MTDLIRRSVLIDEICRSSIYKWSVEEDQSAHNWALNIINSQPSVESSKGDLISRADAIEAICNAQCELDVPHYPQCDQVKWCDEVKALLALPSADAVHGEWIPCSKKMPKELERVNVTWLNHNPPFYYQHIKDIPQIDTAVYYRGKWYWWDATVIDILAEYGEDCNAEQIDKDIEVVAWQPLPKPYECGARMEKIK